MCDKILKENVEAPAFVYKRMQRLSKGKFVTPVMGQILKKGKWEKADVHENPENNHSWLDFIDELFNRNTFEGTPIKVKTFRNSSSFSEHHNGMFATFATKNDAIHNNLISNFNSVATGDRLPTVVVKCKVRGTCHKTLAMKKDGYLSQELMIVEEVCEID